MDEFWHDLRQACERLRPGTAIETPVSERRFEIEATYDDGVDVHFPDSGERRTLRREGFATLGDRLEEEPLSLAELPPGVEPYAAILTLSEDVVSADGQLRRVPRDATDGASPYLVPPEEARTRPERVHDDALLLADLLEDIDADDPGSLGTDRLTDLYVLLSDVQRGADRLRRTVSDALLDRLGPEQELRGRFGVVRRTTRDRRYPKDDATVLSALDEHGVPHEWVLGVDADKLDVVVAVTAVEEADVFDVDEQVYVQKTGADEGEKVSRLRGLTARLDDVEGGEELRGEIADLERRIDEALSAD